MHNPALLVLPIINWEFRQQRPQQLARCFARGGFRVYYPRLRLHPAPAPPLPIESGIWQIALRGAPEIDPYQDRMSAAAAEEALASLLAMAPEHPLDGVWIVAQLPFWRPLAERVRKAFGGRLLFDCMDDFSSFGDHADTREEEIALARAADLVSVTAGRLYDKLAPHQPRTLLVRNGCDPEHFGPAVFPPPAGGRVVVGFFGGIHDWFDAALLEQLAGLRPDWDFWLIGDTYRADLRSLRSLPNVVFLGESPYCDLPRIISHFHVGIIPFQITPLTEATDPVKAYEMLAAGLPVVAVDLPELRHLQPHVAVACTAGEFAARIEEALAEPDSARLRRREVARRHSWVERYLALRQAMDELGPSQSPPAERPSRESLGIGLVEIESLVQRMEELRKSQRSAAAAWEAERGTLVRTAAALDGERMSLTEQRDRVQAEAERLRRELERVEAERVRLEKCLRELAASRRSRLAARLGLLRLPPEGSGRS